MSRPRLSEGRYNQGLQVYRSGGTIGDLIRLADEIEEMHRQENLTNEQHDEISIAPMSIMAGFMDGALEDFRIFVGNRRGGAKA